MYSCLIVNLFNIFLVWPPNFFFKTLVTIPVAPVIIGIIIYFMFHIRLYYYYYYYYFYHHHYHHHFYVGYLQLCTRNKPFF